MFFPSLSAASAAAIARNVCMMHDLSSLWQYGLLSFQMGYIKLERFLQINQHTPKEIIEF